MKTKEIIEEIRNVSIAILVDKDSTGTEHEVPRVFSLICLGLVGAMETVIRAGRRCLPEWVPRCLAARWSSEVKGSRQGDESEPFPVHTNDF